MKNDEKNTKIDAILQKSRILEKIQNLGCSKNEQMLRKKKTQKKTVFNKNSKFQKIWKTTDCDENVETLSKEQEISELGNVKM